MNMDDGLPGGRARLSQARSRVRRDQLVRAAAVLFADGGTKAVTHRSVSEAADVPLATVSYYFASIDQLVDVMFTETLESWLRAWDELCPEAGAELTPEDVGDAFRNLLLQASPEGYAQELRVYLTSLSRPQVRENVLAVQARALESVSALVHAAGVTGSPTLAPTLVMVFAGALVSITDPDAPIPVVGDLLHDQVVAMVRAGRTDDV